MSVHLNLGPKWISPEEQYDRFALPIANELSSVVKDIPRTLINIIAHYAVKTQHVEWYIALKALGFLNIKLPRLSSSIFQELDGECPIYGKEYKLIDTHIFIFIPKELGTLKHFKKILESYGRTAYKKETNPFQFREFTCGKMWNKRVFGTGQWKLITRKALPDTHNQTPDAQLNIVESLNRKTSLNYKIPSPHSMVVGLFFHKIVSGESLYPEIASNIPCMDVQYTHVHGKTSSDSPLYVGGFAEDGLLFGNLETNCCNCIGMGAERDVLTE